MRLHKEFMKAMQVRMKETEKVMKQVDKEERRRSKQQGPSLFSSKPPSKPSSAATTPVLPRYLLRLPHHLLLPVS